LGNTAGAPEISESLPSLSLPPVECCLGAKPIHAARPRPDENVFQSPTSAISAVATIGPTPGISSNRRQYRQGAYSPFRPAPAQGNKLQHRAMRKF
jgi:hypothetical protein